MKRSALTSGLLRLAALVSLLGAGGCAYESPNQPGIVIIDPSAPFQVTIGALPGTGAQAGTAAVTAHVQNANGAGLADVVVTFTTNHGTIAPTSVTTGVDGAASTTLAATDTADVTAAVGRLSAHTFVAPSPPTPTLPAPTPAPGPSPTPTPPLPAVFLNVPANATTGVAVIFSVSSSATGVTWNWSFGDGQTAQTTAFGTTHAYATKGTYAATVSAAGTSSASATIMVTDPPPPVVVPPTSSTASYIVTLSAAPTSVMAGGSAILTAVATGVNNAPTPALYAWDCDNNGSIEFTSSTPSATCTYSTAGNVTGKVTVTGGSATGSATTTVTVTSPPSYIVTLSAAPLTIVAGGSVTLTAVVTGINGAPTPTLYAWDCDNNASIDFASSTPSVTCTYPTAGNITGKVTVTGGTATGSATTTVIVTPVPSYSVVLVSSVLSVVAGGTATLTAGVTPINGAPTPTRYEWDCDNNGSIEFTSSTPSATCTYLTAGNITGKVTVTGGSATGSATTTVTVTP